MRAGRLPPDAILLGRRALDGLSYVELLDDLRWYPEAECWVLHLAVRANTAGTSIPERTEWYAHIEDTYPWGDVTFFPSKHDGLAGTFPHQQQNAAGPTELPWRKGYLCLKTGLAAFGFRTRPEESWDPARKLLWHVQRAVEWLEAASRGQLAPRGDLFELPDLGPKDKHQVAFREDAHSLATWSGITETMGLADCRLAGGNPRVFAVTAFRSMAGEDLLSVRWGELLAPRPQQKDHRALWLLCPAVPVLPPHAAPETWRDLAEAMKACGVDLVERLRQAAPRLHDGQPHLCLIGFPIPERVGGALARMHWWAVWLPELGGRVLAGFRGNERGYWYHDRALLFGRERHLKWVSTDNWHPSELRSRGALPEIIRDQGILLIGAGALGSALAELLVRGGATRLFLVDNQLLMAGNVGRHVLGFPDVRYPKAERLADGLRLLSPDVTVQAFYEPFEAVVSERPEVLDQSGIVIDCTAEDPVIERLGRHSFDTPRVFFSASVGVGARRLMCFSATGSRFPAEAFRRMSDGWIRREHQELRKADLPREGIGCWHPVFPGRADDVLLQATVAMKSLEKAVLRPAAARLEAYEQDGDPDGFRGVNRVELVEEGVQP